MAVLPRAASAAPLTPPGPTTVSCAYSATDCWVTGNFLASVTPSTGGTGGYAYQICRSVDSSSTGFNGCDVNLTLTGGTSISVMGYDLPADGYRRNYWFQGRDSSGAWSGWNVPLSVRVDRYPPTVSASNASDGWYPSRTATISAADATVSAGANSGLAAVRYSWNTLLDIGCTLGTPTASGTTLNAPLGDNYLYLCARDNTGQVAMWSGHYRVTAPLTPPGPTTVSCAYSASDCWVTGDFLASVAPSTGGTGGFVYQICRSVDSGSTGFNGCDVTLTLTGGTSIMVTGTHLPADGYRRNFWFQGRDSAGSWTGWNVPLSVRVDRYSPTVSATNASDTWQASLTATVAAADGTGGVTANSGLTAVRFRWNAALDAGCTAGTAVSPGISLTAPAGDNTLYLCARDLTGRVTQWSGHYRVLSPLTAPGPTTVACAYSTANDCWVTGDFVASVTPSTGGTGGFVYHICRSIDSSSTGFNGCDVTLTLTGGTSMTVTGTHLPADGYRRNFWFQGRDSAGTWSGWNVPLSVRIDRYAPAVGASNASDSWFPSRTATLSADDSTGGAGANSGLAAFRYSWNTPLDAGCTAGTVTSSGATLTAPAGDNMLYLCGRDNTGRVGSWNGRYRVGTAPVPTAPGPTVVACAFNAADCWVTGDFTAGVSPATGGVGRLVYQICRSIDSDGTGFNGCDENLTLDGGPSIAVTGSHLPADGYRRNFWFRARDADGTYGPWNVPLSVRVDRYPPVVSATNASDDWFPSRTATLSANDAAGGAGSNSGLLALRFSWNAALNAGCTNGTLATPGATLAAPAGDNVLYLCGRDNTGRVGTWNGRYRVGTSPISLVTTPSPSQAAVGETVTWTATATGAAPATRQFALFRRRPGSSWIPSLSSPAWQASNSLQWTPVSSNLGTWEVQVWVKDGSTPPNENGYGYSASFDPGPIEVIEPPSQEFALGLSPALATIPPGGTARFTISLTADPGFIGPAALTVSGLPDGVSWTLVPEAIGVGQSATLTVVTNAATEQGVYFVTVAGTAGKLAHDAAATLRVLGLDQPVLNGITPDSFANGGRVQVTVQGSNLSGAEVSIALEQPDPDEPVSRVFPTAQRVSVNPDGTSMVVEIDARDTRILDFYNLVVGSGPDAAAIPFRVLPSGPLVDAWTPSEPQIDRIHALSIAGRNLAGTTLTASAGGRVVLHSVESTDTEITALLEVLPNAPAGPMSLIVRDSAGRTVEVPITIVQPQQSKLLSRNLTESKGGEKLTPAYGRRPAVWFQEFTIRDPNRTEVLTKGLRIHGIDREAYLAQKSRKSISFELYIHVTIPLVRVQWQKVILFDPITGAIGSAVLEGLGVGARVPIGAFVLSAYFEMDLTIYFRLTNTGFSFPLFCIEISYGIEITGFDGFAYHQSFCVGGGWHAFGTGTVSNGSISGGDCASVSQTSFENGLLEGEVQQNACCSQPIAVAMAGHTFTGLSWGRSFSVNNPQAGATTANPGACPVSCPCRVQIFGTAMTPGHSHSNVFRLENPSDEACTYQYEIRQSSGTTQMQLSSTTGTLTLAAHDSRETSYTVSFPTGRPATDVAMIEVKILSPGGGGVTACEASTPSCVYPSGEKSTFRGWWDVEPSDAASFLGTVLPESTDFSGRAVTEGSFNSGIDSFDNCFIAGSPYPNFAQDNLSGGIWDIVAGNDYDDGDLIGMKCTAQGCDLDGYYEAVGRVPCSMGTTQKMSMYCGPVQGGAPIIEYKRNSLLIECTENGTRISRDDAHSDLH